ncbi:MAG: hypothetical protein AB198_02500 [Parcubacteria bacterium C7867-003]|nr:MAG: hypothetical protein AB198_02500 [Parcubacteria bacterium C7867-003]
MTIDFQKVADAIEKASPRIKELMFSQDLFGTLEEIAESNKIEEEIYPEMVDEIGYVILGLKQRSSFASSLEELGFEKTKANFISKEIESKIFSQLDTINDTGFDEKVQEYAERGEWVNKVEEIAKKYSLEDSKKEMLVGLCSETFSNLGNKGQLVNKMVDVLSISRLLAEQIFSDLDARVFNQAIKRVAASEPVTNSPAVSPSVPEIRPENLPMQGSNFIPTPKPAFENETLDKQKDEPSPSIGVPRYASDTSTPVAPKTDARSIIEKKLNEMTIGSKPIETKYQKDPYREPLS